jgi:hypothetical protein
MKNKNYIISYQVLFTDAAPVLQKMRVKNCMSELHAKIKLEDYLKRKHANFAQLAVLNCTEDLGDIFNFLNGLKK